MKKFTRAKFRAFEVRASGLLKRGYDEDDEDDEDGEPIEFTGNSITYYDDDLLICHEGLSRQELETKIAGKKKENEKRINVRAR